MDVLLILTIGALGRWERIAGENALRMLFQDLLAAVMLMRRGVFGTLRGAG